ncbi:spore germination protein [Bacillus aerolatus]|uniref:Spore germination protein n=1 Tax=Bacillus aerolatus TaxID=2653354 RepID=A0A6I1FFP6_9BACI|nr:spore germination protein [Bacillus aerolatus]KAB7706983.1 spore germination protein [Bacillus aerolatus]
MRKKSKQKDLAFQESELAKLLTACGESADFLTFQLHENSPFFIAYFKPLVDPNIVHKDILTIIKQQEVSSLEEIKEKLPIEDLSLTDNVPDIQNKLMTGHLLFYQKEAQSACLAVPAPAVEKRQVSTPETEYVVTGAKEAFVESINTNLNLVRKRLPTPGLRTKELTIGKLSKTKVIVAYIDGVANPENVNTVIQRIQGIEYDAVSDSAVLSQMIADNKNSPFPQLINTELPNHVASVLSEGKVAIFTDGSPFVLTGPVSFFTFFSTAEDYVSIWNIASIFRLIRLFAIAFSILATSTYVAILTYHYEMIPQDVLSLLITSRGTIPFPPFLEAILLELAIELLREAGARLPTKIGQTIGIVGGIVLGTAAVQAGLTSNVLLIVVATGALASFTTPVYQVSNAIRLIRFPFLLFAQLLGLVGVAVGFAFLTAHLLKLTSLNHPFLEPIYPLRVQDFKDSIFRLPFSKQALRPIQIRAENPVRFQPETPPKNDWDIDD